MMGLAFLAAAAPLAGLGEAVRDATGQRPCRAQRADEIVVCARPGESPYRLPVIPDDPANERPLSDMTATAKAAQQAAGPGWRDCTRLHEGCGGTLNVGKAVDMIIKGVGKLLERDD